MINLFSSVGFNLETHDKLEFNKNCYLNRYDTMFLDGNKLGNTFIRIIEVKLSEVHVSTGLHEIYTAVVAENLRFSGGISDNLAGKSVIGDESLSQSRLEGFMSH